MVGSFSMDDISYAIEGDFVETKDGLIFDVKGINHPKDRIIAYLRYMPLYFLIEKIMDDQIEQELKRLSNSSDLSVLSNYIEENLKFKVNDVRLRNSNEVYFKLYDIEARYYVLSKFAKEFIYTHPNYDFPLQAVPIDKIEKVYCPERFLNTFLNDGNDEFKQDRTIKSFIQYLVQGSGISSKFLGISGSKMVNLEKKGESDLDLIIYGEKQSRDVYTFIKKTLDKVGNDPIKINGLLFNVYRNSQDHLKKLYSIRDPYHNSSFEDFCRLENGKFHQFILNKSDVFTRFLKCDRFHNPSREKFEDVKFRTMGRMRIRGIVINDEDSIFTPVRYFIKMTDVKMISTSDTARIFDISVLNNKIIEVFSMRGKYTEHVKNGDSVIVEGKLEKVKLIDSQNLKNLHYYRIIVGYKKDMFSIE